mgnify:CR=1 FL=1
MLHRSLAFFFAVLAVYACLFGCAQAGSGEKKQEDKRAVELFNDGNQDNDELIKIDRRASWFGQCSVYPLYTTPRVNCSLVFTFCLNPSLPGGCQMFMWFWCGETMLYRGDISHTHTGYRMLFVGSPVRDYIELPFFAIFSDNEIPLPVSPVTLLFDRVIFGGMCYVLRPNEGKLPPEFKIPPRESL